MRAFIEISIPNVVGDGGRAFSVCDVSEVRSVGRLEAQLRAASLNNTTTYAP
jgi:hypothetical protein